MAKIESQLAAQTKQLEAVIDLVPVGIGLMRGPSLVFEKTNAKFEALVSPREYIGRSWAEVYPELIDSEFSVHLKTVFETGRPYSVQEHKVVREISTGLYENRYFDISYVCTEDGFGKPYGVCCQCTEVTDRVVARLKLENSEARIRESEERLASAVAVSKVGFYDWDIAANRLKLGRQMKQQWGLREECTLEDVIARIHPDDRKRNHKAITDAILDRTDYHTEYRVIQPDGNIIWIEAQGRTSYDERGNPVRFFGTSLDISDKKKAQEELELAKREAERANAAKSAFLANMSHEIRTPLAAILGFTELMKETITSSERMRFADIIIRSGHSLTRLIDDILDISKVEAGRLELENIDFEIEPVIEEILGLFHEIARAKNVKLTMSIDERTPHIVNSDPVRVRQILLNLIGNAIKFTSKGEVELSVRPLDNNHKTPQLEFQIRDSGVGMSMDQAARLFEPFTQADNSTTRKFGGTGLGLALSRKLANALGGDVRVSACAPSVGCTFVATISTGDTAEKKSHCNLLEVPQIPAAEKIRVLLVEDSEDNRFLVAHALRKAGVEVDFAENGAEGVLKASAADYDVVLMDMQMPIMDGYEATKALRDKGYDKPIVAITAMGMVEESRRVRKLGCDAHVPKPIDYSLLVRTIRDFAGKMHAVAAT